MAVCVRLFCGLFIGVLSLSACGGGGGSSAAPPTVASSHSQQGAAALAVFVPSPSSGSTRRRAQLPSSTQSVEIVAANETTDVAITPVIVNISATTAGCSSVSGGIECTINVTVPYGTLEFGVIGFTGQNATGNPIAWGYTVATISAGGSNAVSITTSSVVPYFTMDLDGNISTAVIDHSANTLTVENLSNDTAISGTVSYLPNGDEKVSITSSSDSGTPVGSIVYLRELVGTAVSFFSTNTASPPANADLSSGIDFGVGTELGACPTAAASYNVGIAAIEGPQYSQTPTWETAAAYQTGTATVSISSGNASLDFSGQSYPIVTGGSPTSESGVAGPCSGGIFAATTGATSSGQIAFDPQGVVVGATSGASATTGVTNGFAGFTVQSGSTINLATLTSYTYDGFEAGYNLVDGSFVKFGQPQNAAPAGSNAFNLCPYTAFEAGTVDTGSNCFTLTLTSQPSPGIVLGNLTPGGIPVVLAVSQVSGKYVMFGVISVGGTNIALFQH
jgi:hypothetical protein